jgi:hypothetical protein
MEELKDGLQFHQIQKAELRKQAKGLQKVHMRDCLLDAQSKQQIAQANAIKQSSIEEKASSCGT